METITVKEIRNERYLMFIDTETIGTLNNKDSVYPFEIGMKVLDTQTNEVVKEKSYLVRKFFNNKYVMMSTFSSSKYPTYFEKIEKDKRYCVESVPTISKELQKAIEKYNINFMVAHNGMFDKNAMTRLFEEFATPNPFENIDLIDTMELAYCIATTSIYRDYCIQNKDVKNAQKDSAFITNSGRVRTTAQALYSFLTRNPNFEEAHTGLEDIDIEIEIFKKSVNVIEIFYPTLELDLNSAPTWRDFPKVVE